MADYPAKTVVISGATDGMGRATALERLARGDTVIAIGSNETKGRSLVADAARTGFGDRLRFVRADLSSVAENQRVVTEISRDHPAVDALVLFANRQSPRRQETTEGLEHTFALYYLSRYLLSRGLGPVLDASPDPVIVSVAGVGNTAGSVNWDDLQLTRRYSTLRAQLQAGRANDLLGVAFAEHGVSRARFVLYHPGFTRSGDLSPLNPLVRVLIRILGTVAARPVTGAVRPVHGFVDSPPREPLTAIDRGKPVDPSLKTLDRHDARRLAEVTEEILHDLPTRTSRE
ncbi:NAD(P)-dependent dehydrogenase, short-chain alcohol dehydrogenase family [Amycolatopsis marina]|uniref:NAD(P)-dependent dehydrogenase, short-chain alcohol dehydrogenase family n=1 Tax=Amycolatopsis marina TaxID=490629 RepID=A0A1I0ZU70_9PSEU|nr:SDR family NAD(P)-dependent oxidoreductase [Amycolatopsis marina]SFB29067.1 NAD(P)-dependent dehydrogenase, short-chain alcohol dehydrogenase family [Amycolatopsis marina]